MVHAALLLLMLEAVTTDLGFTISLKRSTPNLQLFGAAFEQVGRLAGACRWKLDSEKYEFDELHRRPKDNTSKDRANHRRNQK